MQVAGVGEWQMDWRSHIAGIPLAEWNGKLVPVPLFYRIIFSNGKSDFQEHAKLPCRSLCINNEALALRRLLWSTCFARPKSNQQCYRPFSKAVFSLWQVPEGNVPSRSLGWSLFQPQPVTRCCYCAILTHCRRRDDSNIMIHWCSPHGFWVRQVSIKSYETIEKKFILSVNQDVYFLIRVRPRIHRVAWSKPRSIAVFSFWL